jgi:uncharacterized membrane protein
VALSDTALAPGRGAVRESRVGDGGRDDGGAGDTAPEARGSGLLVRVWRGLRAEGRPLAVLCALMALYVVVFGWLTWQQHRNYSTFGFDMGIHDQGIWLLSRFEDPYVTVVGRNYLGHHLNLIAFAYVPFYWLGAGPTFLYLSETVALALGAVPVYLLARDQLASRWAGTAFGAAYLLFPTVQWINWWHFHPDALMITPLLFAWWFATRKRWAWFAVCAALAMVAKEDATTAVVMMGVVLTIRLRRTDRLVGPLTVAGGVAWFLLATKVLMPHFNDGELAFYEDFFPGLGHGLGDIVGNAIRHPSRWYDPMLGRSTPTGVRDGPALDDFRSDVYRYYVRMLLPMCVVALRKPMLLLIAAPMLVINVLSSLSYTHDARFHYSAIVLVAVVLASIEGAAALGRRSDLFRHVAVGAVLGFALVTNVLWSPSPLNEDVHRNGTWARPLFESMPPGTADRDAMVALVPSDAGVSATYALTPHLTHRKIVYEFPNPWWLTNWLDCRTTPRAEAVDHLVVDTTVLSDVVHPRYGLSPRGLFERLVDPDDGEFRVVGEAGPVTVAQRVSPPELTFDTPRPRCDR